MKIQLTQANKPLSIFSYSSLTDIVLLLLIFFLLTSSFIVTEGLNVTLPEAEHTATVEDEQLVIALLNDGRIFLNNVEIPLDQFRAALQEKLVAPTSQVIVLSSDADVPLQRAVFVMDEAKGLGATRFFISTAQKDDDDLQQ
ncbi:MAG: biopolymer transporter ExbD [Bacteroidota bacterium]|jgi:biopolymer transport protein ExbD|nr:biopolymer transporter ExbD [Bacteroidota bacterium]